MKVDFSKIIYDINDKPLMNIKMVDKVRTETPFTLGKVCVDGLLANDATDTTPAIKLDKYGLAMKIHTAGPVSTDVTAEEIVLLKNVVAKQFATIVVGRVNEILEGE